MKLLIPLLSLAVAGLLHAETEFTKIPHQKPRLFVLTDLSNEPDDEQSFVRLLVNADMFDIEGLIATTSNWLKSDPREDLIRRDIAAYEKVLPNLLKHSPDFPDSASLLAATGTGQPTYGMTAVGEGHSSVGSQKLIEAVDRADDRPLWVTAWGGPNTLAQALWEVRETRSEKELAKFVSKIRVYAISDQDDSGPWMRKEFPELFYIVSPSNPHSYLEYYEATWSGISSVYVNQTEPGYHGHMVQNPWLRENIIHNHGPLGELYPEVMYIMEGDTPSFLGLIDRGLGWEISPEFGGWGGRYNLFQKAGETRPIWTDNALTRDRVEVAPNDFDNSTHATIWRWREHYQNDFAARMDWCIAETYSDANHNPRPVLNGDNSTDVLRFTAKPGDSVSLDASGSTAGDDGQNITYKWWIYTEASSVEGAKLSTTDAPSTNVLIPSSREPGDIHVILEVKDDGSPNLFAYRRAIISVR